MGRSIGLWVDESMVEGLIERMGGVDGWVGGWVGGWVLPFWEELAGVVVHDVPA